MKIARKYHILPSIALALILPACGGGSNSPETPISPIAPSEPTPQPPQPKPPTEPVLPTEPVSPTTPPVTPTEPGTGDGTGTGETPVDVGQTAAFTSICNIQLPAIPPNHSNALTLVHNHQSAHSGVTAKGSSLAASGTGFPISAAYPLHAAPSGQSTTSNEAIGSTFVFGPLGDQAIACSKSLGRPIAAGASISSYYGGWNVLSSFDQGPSTWSKTELEKYKIWGGHEYGANFTPERIDFLFTLNSNSMSVLENPSICTVASDIGTKRVQCYTATLNPAGNGYERKSMPKPTLPFGGTFEVILASTTPRP